MKKETRRYSIAEYVGKTVRKVKNKEEYNGLVNNIRKINDEKTHEFYYGNISKRFTDDGIEVTIHMYNKLTLQRTIRDIIEEIRKYRGIKNMLEAGYNAQVKHFNPDVYIIYFETKNSKDKDELDVDIGIKPLPLFFECDQKYLDESYIKKCVISHALNGDLNFFRDLLTEFRFSRDASDALDKLEKNIRLVEAGNVESVSLSVNAMDLYRKLVIERDSNGRAMRDDDGNFEKSCRRVLDFGSFVRDREMPARKKLSATRYNTKQDPRNIGKEPTEEEKEVKFLR